MTTLDDREQRTLSKRCTKCGEVKKLEEFPPHAGRRDGRHSWCRVCNAQYTREARWAKKGIPPEDWPRLHQEAEARSARRNNAPDGFKVCSLCHEVKPLEDFPPHKRGRCGRGSWCRVCDARRKREASWEKQGIPPEEWPRLHQEADRKAEAQATRRNSVPDGFKACARCDEVKPLAEFPLDKRKRDGRQSQCRVCAARRDREAYWKKRGIPPEEWPRLHQEADRQRRMRELAVQHGLKYCADCDMCLGRGFFYRDSSNADGLHPRCKACQSVRNAAYSHTHQRAARRRRAATTVAARRNVACRPMEQGRAIGRRTRKRSRILNVTYAAGHWKPMTRSTGTT